MAELRALTFNTCFAGPVRERLVALAGLIERSSYDVVCLQEVVTRRRAKMLLDGIGGGWHAAFTPLGPLVRGGLVTLSRRPIEATRSTTFSLRPLPPIPAAGDWLIRKGALLTRLTVDGLPLVVVNTHLLANTDGDWSPSNRFAKRERAQLQALAGEVANIDPTALLLLAGDLNVPTASAAYQELLASTGLLDVAGPHPEPTYRTTARVPDPQPIDHLLVRPPSSAELTVVDCGLAFRHDRIPVGRRGAVDLSDHYGLETVLRIV
jgi:endonuclease/exonuclease/phosphatase family metal-dependent hydrolase